MKELLTSSTKNRLKEETTNLEAVQAEEAQSKPVKCRPVKCKLDKYKPLRYKLDSPKLVRSKLASCKPVMSKRVKVAKHSTRGAASSSHAMCPADLVSRHSRKAWPR